MKFKNIIIEIMILIGVFGLLIYSSDPFISRDSQRYISGGFLDPPFLSLVIKILLALFGNLKAVIILQTLLVGFSIIYFTRTVNNIFNLDNIMKFIISLFLFLPIIKFYNNLLTETFGYAFSLLFVSFGIKLINKFNKTNIFWISVFSILLLLLRTQFLFLYPLVLFLYLGIFIINKSKKTFIKLTISFIFIIFISSSLTSLDKYMNPLSFEDQTELDKYGYGPFYFTYIDSIYISTKKDIKLFENKNYQSTLGKIHQEMDEREKLIKYYDGRGHFGLSFSAIRDYSETPLKNLATQENISVSDLKKKISIKLLSANFEKYAYLIFKKFYDSTWLFIFIPFFMLLASFIWFVRNKSQISLIIIFVSLFTIANHSTIYLFGRVQPRYLIYSDFILLILIFILFSTFLKKNKL